MEMVADQWGGKDESVTCVWRKVCGICARNGRGLSTREELVGLVWTDALGFAEVAERDDCRLRTRRTLHRQQLHELRFARLVVVHLARVEVPVMPPCESAITHKRWSLGESVEVMDGVGLARNEPRNTHKRWSVGVSVEVKGGGSGPKPASRAHPRHAPQGATGAPNGHCCLRLALNPARSTDRRGLRWRNRPRSAAVGDRPPVAPRSPTLPPTALPARARARPGASPRVLWLSSKTEQSQDSPARGEIPLPGRICTSGCS